MRALVVVLGLLLGGCSFVYDETGNTRNLSGGLVNPCCDKPATDAAVGGSAGSAREGVIGGSAVGR